MSKETPWMDWMYAREGWSEKTHDKELAKYWPLCGLHFKTIVGRKHAWCALTICAALHESGYAHTAHAGARSYDAYGTPCEPVYGAITTIRYESGSRHVTTFVRWSSSRPGYFYGLGGNQGNALCTKLYHKSQIVATRWPVKKVAKTLPKKAKAA